MQCVSRAGPSRSASAEPVALAHQHVLVRHFEPVEFQLAMAAMLLGPEDRDRRTMRQPG